MNENTELDNLRKRIQELEDEVSVAWEESVQMMGMLWIVASWLGEEETPDMTRESLLKEVNHTLGVIEK